MSSTLFSLLQLQSSFFSLALAWQFTHIIIKEGQKDDCAGHLSFSDALTLIRYCHDKVKACYLLESQGARYQPRLQPWSPLASWVVPSLQKEWSQQCLKSATFLECRQLPAVALTCICRSLRPQFSPIYTHRYTGIPIYPGPIGLFRRTTIQIGYRLLQSLQQRHFAWSGELLQYSLPK